MQLPGGATWSIPIVMDISDDDIRAIKSSGSSTVQLVDKDGTHFANLTDIEIYDFDKSAFC